MNSCYSISPHPKIGRGEKLPGDMLAAPSDDADSDLAAQLHITGTMAGALTGLAHDLTVKLPLTLAALRDGIIDIDKARTIAVMCWPLTPEQARRAERILFGLDGVEEMTWGMIRTQGLRPASPTRMASSGVQHQQVADVPPPLLVGLQRLDRLVEVVRPLVQFLRHPVVDHPLYFDI